MDSPLQPNAPRLVPPAVPDSVSPSSHKPEPQPLGLSLAASPGPSLVLRPPQTPSSTSTSYRPPTCSQPAFVAPAEPATAFPNSAGAFAPRAGHPLDASCAPALAAAPGFLPLGESNPSASGQSALPFCLEKAAALCQSLARLARVQACSLSLR